MALKLLSRSEVKDCITMLEAIDAMERAFLQLAHNETVLPLRTGVSIGDSGLMLTMPAYLNEEKSLGLKVVSVFPNNSQHQIPSINGVILLLDASTGEPLTLMDAGYLTALRTGAISGLATKYFSRENATNLAIIGTGTQAVTQLESVTAVRDIKKVNLWSRNVDNAKLFAKNIKGDFDIEVCNDLSSAVRHADIICTATASTEPLVHLQDIQPHTHINAVGSHHRNMREIANDVLHKAIVIVDLREAALAESGEIISAIEESKITPDSIIELGSWLANDSADCREQLTVFKSVGLAIQDLSVAQAVYQNATRKNKGTSFSLDR